MAMCKEQADAYQVASAAREKGRRGPRECSSGHACRVATLPPTALRPCRGTCRGWATRLRTTPRGGRAIAVGTGYAPAYDQLPATHHAMMHAGELAHFYQGFFFFQQTRACPRRICYPGRPWHARAYTRDSVGTVPGALACASIHQDCILTLPLLDALVCAAHPPVLHPRTT